MKRYSNRPANYDKFPAIDMAEKEKECWSGWENITHKLKEELALIDQSRKTLLVECYQGVLDEEIITALKSAFPEAAFFYSEQAMLSQEEIDAFFQEDITEDEIFGYMTRYTMEHYFNPHKLKLVKEKIDKVDKGVIILYGTGASLLMENPDVWIYADMARWEIQQRFRKNIVNNIGVDNKEQRAALQYKRAFFVDWRICDRFKKKQMSDWNFVLDTNIPDEPKMATGDAVRAGLTKAVKQPFRVVPFFDPGPWGGQWMKEVCDLDAEKQNYAWCFDCVPEENSLYLSFGKTRFEIPSVNVVFAHPRELLGNSVHARFGDEFPIRFDFLDTMEGGNLSLQVHPLTEYIQKKFGMHYTQDESYYMLDAQPDAVVYLGLKEGIEPDSMIRDLKEAQQTGNFDAEKYVGVYPVKKHDHVLIPAGTIHCSGTNSMVLEISATPYIFTFKLWDWGRLGLDGRPRPINIEHGEKVIQWERTESWVRKEILDRVERLTEGDGWREEHTGLHEREFIETRRHWFTKPVLHHTNSSVNVLNLVEGREAIIESPEGAFEPFIVHYAETFIIPEAVGSYTIRPYGESKGEECATLKAYVRNHA